MPNQILKYPSDYTGWTSCELAYFYHEDYHRFTAIDQELKADSPSLRFLFTWRSLKWRIVPDNYTLALRLIEDLWTIEISEWSPEILLRNIQQPAEPWLKVAQAIQENDQAKLDQTLAEAQKDYSLLGYQILLRGYESYVSGWKDKFTISFPS